MANSRLCDNCAKGKQSECIGRFKAESNRTVESRGQLPRRPLYSYKCPNLVETPQ